MRISKLLVPILVFTFAFWAGFCFADACLISNVLSDKGIEEVHLGARLGSYKPDLHQLDAILKQLDMSAPGAATMFNVFARFKGSPQLSYLIEAGYWENGVSIEAASVDLGTTFTQLSFSLLYYPEMIQEFLPLYLGIGGGIAHLKLDGTALALLKEVITESADTGASGSFIAGLEYTILEGLVVSVQANHIFKSFIVDEDGKQEFSFDGTVVSIGVSVRL